MVEHKMRFFGLSSKNKIVDESYEPGEGEVVVFVPLSMDEVIELKERMEKR